MTINKLEAYAKIKDSDGKFFTARFIKKDGSLRTMTARLGVRKGLTGTGLAFNPLSYLLIPVFDIQKHEYRMINLNTMLYLKTEGEEYNVI